MTSARIRYNDSNCLCFKQKLRRLLHWGPLVALWIIFYIAFVSLRCCLQLAPVSQSLVGAAQFFSICFLLYLILSFFFSACFMGPGFVPLGWRPSDPTAEANLQFCENCQGFKPPRAHHCRKCDRCVMKMDHHCPWINTCCGHLNHGYFLLFLLVVPVGCTLCSIVLAISAYRSLFWLPFLGHLSIYWSLFEAFTSIFCLGLSIGVTLAVGTLAVVQLIAISKNETGIESWIIAKANHRTEQQKEAPFVYPYNLGRVRNLKQVLSWSGRPIGDGFEWPLRNGCDQYDLTTEQRRQKHLKQHVRQKWEIVRSYPGGYFRDCLYGVRVACCPPCPDECRLAVRVGDIVCVTRTYRHWLYGHLEPRESEKLSGSRPRGWFPRVCAIHPVTPKRETNTANSNHFKAE